MRTDLPKIRHIGIFCPFGQNYKLLFTYGIGKFLQHIKETIAKDFKMLGKVAKISSNLFTLCTALKYVLYYNNFAQLMMTQKSFYSA